MKRLSLTAVGLALAMGALPASAKSPKRGVGENQFALATQIDILKPGVSWFYTWGNTPSSGYQSQVVNSCTADFEFVPMCWNAAYSADNIRTWCASHPEAKYLLGFNEPNFTAQSNMTPAEAAAKWPEVQALAKELGLMLVAPALNYSPNAPYQDPLKWMDEFVALVGADAFDYVAIHNYGGLGVMKTLANNFHDRYGKPVWVTEFCYWPNEGDANSYVAPATQIGEMINTVQWLEQTDWIFRYAWFKPVGKHDSNPSPNYGLIVTENGLGERTLSPQGYVYTYLPTFDRDVWLPVGQAVAARDFVNQSSILMNQTTDPTALAPIDITQFNAGAYVDYQFDVPAAGDYTLTLRCAGQGEPTRFDPCIEVQLVDGDAVKAVSEKVKFTLSGDDATFEEKPLTLTLPAGRLTLRLADGNPYEPSGIRISTLTLTSNTPVPDPSGIADIAGDRAAAAAAVYTLQGVRLPNASVDNLPSGTYIVDGRLVRK